MQWSRVQLLEEGSDLKDMTRKSNTRDTSINQALRRFDTFSTPSHIAWGVAMRPFSDFVSNSDKPVLLDILVVHFLCRNETFSGMRHGFCFFRPHWPQQEGARISSKVAWCNDPSNAHLEVATRYFQWLTKLRSLNTRRICGMRTTRSVVLQIRCIQRKNRKQAWLESAEMC